MSTPIFAQALIAELNYDAELRRVYGKHAVEARYDRKRNEATPELKRLAGIWHTLTESLRNHITTTQPKDL